MTLAAADMSDLRSRYPRILARHPAARAFRFALFIAGLAAIAWLARRTELLSLKFLAGISRVGAIVQGMWPPEAGSAGTLASIGSGLAQTVAMAFLGTLVAALIAVPLGFLGARLVVRNPAVHFLIRRAFDMFRGMPALIWALVFARAVGLGPMTGVLAFIAADFAPLSKLFAEAIEAADTKALEGVRSTGATGLAALRFGLLPQVMPNMLSQALYFFESNVRSASILGIVGAGGIGGVLDEAIKFSLWHEVLFILIGLFVMVFLIDQASGLLRARLIGRERQ
ncbi:MAG: phosphonate ABC transporter, permease protein PhnE [Alphaproteobacteria bacterium]